MRTTLLGCRCEPGDGYACRYCTAMLLVAEPLPEPEEGECLPDSPAP
jgi:hypothetical protein